MIVAVVGLVYQPIRGESCAKHAGAVMVWEKDGVYMTYGCVVNVQRSAVAYVCTVQSLRVCLIL